MQRALLGSLMKSQVTTPLAPRLHGDACVGRILGSLVESHVQQGLCNPELGFGLGVLKANNFRNLHSYRALI